MEFKLVDTPYKKLLYNFHIGKQHQNYFKVITKGWTIIFFEGEADYAIYKKINNSSTEKTAENKCKGSHGEKKNKQVLSTIHVLCLQGLAHQKIHYAQP